MKRFFSLLLLCLLFTVPSAAITNAFRDSVMHSVLSIEDDSIRLRKMFICAQNHMDEFWTLDLLDSGRIDAARQHHVAWELSFMGSKVRWAHRHHDWKRMDQFLQEQRKASFQNNSLGNYMSQIAQSVIVLSGVGMYEQAWKYIEQIKNDVEAGGNEGERNRAYIYLAEANYYQSRGENEKCRDTYLLALRTCSNVSPSQRLAIHNGLIGVCNELEEYEKALEHADSMIAIYYTFSEDHQRVPNSRAMLVECELHKAESYMHLWQFDKMRQCIERAESKAEGTPSYLFGDLYYWWHRYYFMTNDYQKSLEYLDIAAECLRKDQYYEQAKQRELDKVMSIWAQGKYDEALNYYTAKLIELDTLQNSMIASQQEYHSQLNDMLRKEEANVNMQLWASRIMTGVGFTLFAFIMWAVTYLLYSRRKLKHNHSVTSAKLAEARLADQTKEKFLHAITTLINDPLQNVVADAKRLAAGSEMPDGQQDEMLKSNKQHINRLMTLVNNVLDLSRLEAGMMKYNVAETDIVQLLSDTARSYNYMHPDSPIEIKSELEHFRFNIDTGRFTTMINTLCSATVDHPDWKPKCIVAQMRHGGGGKAMLVLMGTRYSHDDLTEAEQMTNLINHHFLASFGATYAVGYGAITIVFPASNS